MGRARKLEIVPREWDADAERLLADLWDDPRDGAPHYDVLQLRADVTAGHCQLYGVSEADRLVAVFVLRIDQIGAELEFCVVAAAGGCPGIDLTANVVPVIQAWARDNGAHYVRVHTDRPGMLRKLGKLGFAMSEYVVRWRAAA